MEPKKEYKRLAEKMRLQGLTYSEILKSLPVSKSSLSLWLHSITLSTNNKARIETLKLAGQKAGAKMRHQNRIDQQNTLIATTQKEISKLIKDPFHVWSIFVLGRRIKTETVEIIWECRIHKLRPTDHFNYANVAAQIFSNHGR